jgi:hypothetical protein
MTGYFLYPYPYCVIEIRYNESLPVGEPFDRSRSFLRKRLPDICVPVRRRGFVFQQRCGFFCCKPATDKAFRISRSAAHMTLPYSANVRGERSAKCRKRKLPRADTIAVSAVGGAQIQNPTVSVTA